MADFTYVCVFMHACICAHTFALLIWNNCRLVVKVAETVQGVLI